MFKILKHIKSNALKKIINFISFFKSYKKILICFVLFVSIFSFFNSFHVVVAMGQGYLVSVYKSGNGSGTIASSPTGINCGSVCSHTFIPGYITLVPTPNSTSYFDYWDTGSGYFYLDGATSATAVFTQKPLVMASYGDGSGGTVSPESQYVNPGSSATITAYPASGYYTSAASGCGGYLSGNTFYTGTIYSGCNVSFTFSPTTVMVYANAGNAGGSVSPTSTDVSNGATQVITAYPDAGYYAASGDGCGGSLSGNTYTTGAVYSACTVTIYFALSPCYSGPSGYTKCSDEDGTCSFSGGASVAFGCSGSYNYQDQSNSVSCSNAQFGDPLPGYLKACFYKSECIGTPWGTVGDGYSNTAYSSPTVPFGSSCSSQTRTCSGGSMDGSYGYTSCTVDAPADCSLPWGGSITHGDSRTAYASYNADTCSSETRSCYNGSLSGSYGASSCTVNAYTYNFNGNGATSNASPTSVYQNYGTGISTPGAPSRTGYTFTGWSPGIPGTMPSGGGTSYAQWSDQTPPSAPGAMTVSWTGDHYVNGNFTASTSGASDSGSGIRGYRLCRSQDNSGGCYTWTAAGEHAGTSETVSGADLPSVGTFRYYYWYAFDNAGNQSSNSDAVYVRMDGAAPTTPGIMTTSWVGDHYVNTNFTASTSGSSDAGSVVSYYNLCRSEDNSSGCSTWVATGIGSSTTVSGSNLPSNGAYRYYYWYAYDAFGNQSGQSTGEYVRMDTSAPSISSISASNAPKGSSVRFYVNASDGGSGLNHGNAVFYLGTYPYSGWNRVSGGAMSWNGSQYYYDVTLNDTYGTTYRAYTYVYDNLGNQGAYDANPIGFSITNTAPPISTPSSPSNGATVSGNGSNVTFTTNAVTDADGQTVQYYFRVASGIDGETSVACNSGWQTSTSYACNPGPGTFYWHVYTYDGVTQTNPNYTWSFYNNYQPSGISISPTSGSFKAGAQTFTSVYRDPNGATDINYVHLLMNNVGIDGNNTAFYGYYIRASNTCNLFGSDGNQAWNGVPYALPFVTLTSCSSSVSGTDLTVTWNLNFTNWVESGMQQYLYVVDNSGWASGWSGSYGSINVDTTATYTFAGNGATTNASPASVTQNYGTSIATPTAPSRTGYTFTGWSPSIPSTMPVNGGTSTAQWTINSYTITFDSAGGSAVSAITQNYGTSVSAPASPTKTGYTFAGWSPAVPSTMPATSQTLTATWTANSYPVTWNPNTGGSSSGVANCTYNTTVTPTCTPSAGYSTSSCSAFTCGTSNSFTPAFSANSYSITFNSNGGTSVTTITQNYGTSITPPANPTKTGYTFSSWSPAIPSTMPVGGANPVAQWTINSYTLTYAAGSNGTISGTASQSINYGSDGTTVTAVPNAHYHFVNWSDSSTTNPRTDLNISAPISVTASFAVDTFTVSTSTNTGGTISPVSSVINYGATTTFTVTPTTGYIVSASGCGGSLVGTTYTTGAITGTCTVTATFTQIVLPTITTGAVNNITINSATANGNITDTGNEVNDRRGIVYDIVSHSLPGNIAPSLTSYLNKIEELGSFGIGSFTSLMTGLTNGLSYYVRAYSHNSIGYTYGNEVSFSTEVFPIISESSYRFFSNLNSTNVGSSLAPENTSYTLANSGDSFRLRVILGIGTSTLPINGANFKLQYSPKVGTCDYNFVGENYVDVTTQTNIAYHSNYDVKSGYSLSTNINDPTHNLDTVFNQTYVDSGSFTNSASSIPAGQYGEWDFSLYDKGVQSSASYCLRVVKLDGSLLDGYSMLPEVTTAVYKSRSGGTSSVENSVTPSAPQSGGGNSSGGSNIEVPIIPSSPAIGGANQNGGTGDLGSLEMIKLFKNIFSHFTI